MHSGMSRRRGAAAAAANRGVLFTKGGVQYRIGGAPPPPSAKTCPPGFFAALLTLGRGRHGVVEEQRGAAVRGGDHGDRVRQEGLAARQVRLVLPAGGPQRGAPGLARRE